MAKKSKIEKWKREPKYKVRRHGAAFAVGPMPTSESSGCVVFVSANGPTGARSLE